MEHVIVDDDGSQTLAGGGAHGTETQEERFRRWADEDRQHNREVLRRMNEEAAARLVDRELIEEARAEARQLLDEQKQRLLVERPLSVEALLVRILTVLERR